MIGKDRTGEWIFDLYKDGAFFAQRSLNCGKSMARDAIKQWERNGYTVVTKRQPNGEEL